MFTLKNKALAIGALAALMLGGAYTANAGMLDGDKDNMTAAQMSEVKISITDAIQKSVEKHQGTIVKAELENEDGRLVYEVEYLENGEEVEMLVDAVTGEVMSGDDEAHEDKDD
jgi:uncharacterized membrane protein YkoI